MAVETDAESPGEWDSSELTEFVHGVTYDRCPPDAIETARLSIVDTIGVSLAGVGEPSVEKAAAYADATSAVGDASVPGREGDYAPEFAGLLSGVQGHALDFDDVTYTYPIHPSVTIVPTLFAVGETVGATGEELLAAYVAAFEFEIRVPGGIGIEMLEADLHPTAVAGVFGSVVAAGKLRGLSHEELRHAIGIVASLSSGSSANFGTMTKPLHAGVANRNGILAADLAARGFTANPDVLDEPTGPWPGTFEDYDLQEACADLDETWYAAEGIGIKRYPSCGITHAAIDATSRIREAVDDEVVVPDEVESIRVQSTPAATDQLRYVVPEEPLHGKFSMYYTVATALLDGTVELNHFTEDAIERPEVHDLMDRIDFEVDDDLAAGSYIGGSLPSRVTVTTTGGRVERELVEQPSGTPENPLSEDEVEEKFASCASRALPEDSVETVYEQLVSLADCGDVRDITANLHPS